MKSNRFIYHYCAHYQHDGNVTYIDGIMQLESKVLSMKDYTKLKPQIESEHHGKLTISSLTFIGREDD